MTEVVKADKNQNWFKKHKVLTGILVVFVLFVLIGLTGGDDKKTDTPKDVNATSSDATPAAATMAKETQPAPAPKVEEPKVPAEYKSALSQATTYANSMNLSKQGVYDQLVSEYGGKFTPEAAQYAIDNVKADWNANALSQAKTYQNDMHLSPAAVRDQLVSAYGGKFTAAEADYAIQHLNG